MTAGVLMAAVVVAIAQPPVVRQKLADLSYVLGEAHALAGVCGGPGDLRWRARMNRLLDLEAREPAFRNRLADSFNAGFVARQAEFRACTAESRKAEVAVAAHGASLARDLAAAPL
ncbi:MAG: TIGR02301 family protein [Caulobacteraceae bacterium]